MRMRNKKWARPYLKECNFVISNPQEYKGKWSDKKIHVEIGSGKGDYIVNMALMYPDIMWIGIEKNENVAAIMAKHLVEANVNNVLLIIQDATDLILWFDKNEIDVIHLNFSDPWPKKRNTKRRLSNIRFLEKYSNCLNENGKIIMKTDNASLFEYSILEFCNNNWILEDISVDFRKNEHNEDAISEYESKFMKKGNPIYRCIVGVKK